MASGVERHELNGVPRCPGVERIVGERPILQPILDITRDGISQENLAGERIQRHCPSWSIASEGGCIVRWLSQLLDRVSGFIEEKIIARIEREAFAKRTVAIQRERAARRRESTTRSDSSRPGHNPDV